MTYYNPQYPQPSYFTGTLSDVTWPGVVIPPIGVAQALAGHPMVAPRGAGPAQPPAPPNFDWKSLAAKVALVAGGIAVVYAIHQITHRQASMQEHVSEAAGGVLRGRMGLGAPSNKGRGRTRSRSRGSSPHAPRLPSLQSTKLLLPAGED